MLIFDPQLGGGSKMLQHDNPHTPLALACVNHQELILFSRADLERSIPSMVDGLKPGQRKILYCCFKRNLKKDIKVRVLAPAVCRWYCRLTDATVAVGFITASPL